MRQIRHSENGNVLVTSLLILLVMNLLGVGLANLSTREWTMATFKSVDAEVFHMTDTCSQDVKNWFENQSGTPDVIPEFASNLEELTEGMGDEESNKLQGYSYDCNVEYKLSQESTISSEAGGEVGNSGGSYGSSGSIVIKDYYRITATGTGPKNSIKTINTIISVEY